MSASTSSSTFTNFTRYKKGDDMFEYLRKNKIDLPEGFTVTPSIEDSTIDKTTEILEAEKENWNENNIMVTLGQLKVGLTFPLYANNSLMFEILNQFRVKFSITQLTGNTIRILKEYCLHSKDKTSYKRNPAAPIDPQQYTAVNFFENYKLAFA